MRCVTLTAHMCVVCVCVTTLTTEIDVAVIERPKTSTTKTNNAFSKFLRETKTEKEREKE